MHWLPALLVIAVLLGLVLALRQHQAARDKVYPKAPAAPAAKPAWGKQVALPSNGRFCQAVRNIANKKFKLHEAPPLPLHECTCKFDCQCKYRLLEDRRSGKERRTGVDRRPVVRYDPKNPPRRSGRDRREENNSAFNDRTI